MRALAGLPRASARAREAARVRQLLIARFGEGEERWLVVEAACAVPGRPARQTAIACLHPAASLAFRIPKPVEDIDSDDVAALGAAAVALAAEGCC